MKMYIYSVFHMPNLVKLKCFLTEEGRGKDEKHTPSFICE